MLPLPAGHQAGDVQLSATEDVEEHPGFGTFRENEGFPLLMFAEKEFDHQMVWRDSGSLHELRASNLVGRNSAQQAFNGIDRVLESVACYVELTLSESYLASQGERPEYCL